MTNVPAQYQGYVTNAANSLGIPASVVAAQIQLESSWDPSVVSPAGAEGIAQFEPATFAAYGPSGGSPFNVSDAFQAYVSYMSDLLKQEGGDVRKALEAYNAGPGNLSAGSGYASTILSNAGTGDVTSGGGGGTTTTQASFVGSVLNFFGLNVTDDLAKMVGKVFGPITQVFKDFDQALSAAMTALLWIVNPMNWLRIFAGIIGVASVITGAVLVAKAG